MFGISGTELFIIIVFVLIIFGPDKLPQFGRTIGQFMREFKRAQESMEAIIRAEVYASNNAPKEGSTPESEASGEVGEGDPADPETPDTDGPQDQGDGADDPSATEKPGPVDPFKNIAPDPEDDPEPVGDPVAESDADPKGDSDSEDEEVEE